VTGQLSYLAAQEHIHDLQRAQEQRRAAGFGRERRRKPEAGVSVRASVRWWRVHRRLRLA
jgi:hypothetical protein